MYALLLKGLLLGFTLSFMIGPLFFSIVEATLDRGYRAGLAVAAGIWCSDILFILAVQKGMEAMKHIVALNGFRFWAGILGGLMLIAFGLTTWLNGKKTNSVSAKEQQILVEEKGITGLWLRGFLINSFNPGTLVFWLGTATGIVAPQGWNTFETYLFFGAMMAVLILTDALKIYGAKFLRVWLTPTHILMVRRSIGLVLFVFGLVLALSEVIGGQ
jgi:threonine/homoserine/homoserine lactone efflux protein